MDKDIGRNDTCPCGSRKKYKKCCIAKTTVNFEPIDFEWRKLRKLEGAVVDRHLIPYALQELPKGVIEQAISDCLPEDLPESMDRNLLFERLFMPWFLFSWIPFDDFGLSQFESELTIAQNYMKYRKDELNRAKMHFLEAMNQTYYSFYSVLNVEAEKSLVVKDILLGTTHSIKEKQGTHHLKRGDVIFSRILTLDGQSIFTGMAPFIIPAGYHSDLLDFKQWLIEENDHDGLTPGALRDWLASALFDCFFDIMQAAYNKPLPTLVNTDDELIQFSKSYFKLTKTPEEALNRLLPLTLSADPEDFLHDSERDESGEISRIEFPWLRKGNKKHQGWDNTVMGHIIVEKGKLTLEVNSEKRTKRGQKLLRKYLGDAICFQQTLIETPEQKLQSSPKPSDDDHNDIDLLEFPEVQEQIKAMATAHWESWFDELIPALGDETPRDAARTEEGRERLEALLLQYGRYDLEKDDNDPFKADTQYLRAELALDE